MFRPRALESALKNRALSWALLLGLIAAQLAFRCYGYLVTPDLRAEDGAKVFAYFYVHRGWLDLFRFKAGYLPLLPNVLGFVSVRMPARATPYFLTIAPTALTLATFSVVYAAAYRRYVPKDGVRFLLCMALAVAPIGDFFTVCHTDYSIWNALLLLLLLVLVPMPRRIAWKLLFALVIAVLIWTHPLTILALPATLLWVWRDKGIINRVLHALLVACQLAHIRFGTLTEKAALVKASGASDRIAMMLRGVLDEVCRRVIVPSVCPWAPRSPEFDYTFSGLFLLALLLAALLPRERLVARRFYAWVAYGILAPMTLIVLARGERLVRAERYHYVSNAFTTLALCLILWQVLFSVTRRWSGRFGLLRLLPALCPLLYFVWLDQFTGALARYRQRDQENGKIVAGFFSALAEAERKQGGHCNIVLRCKKTRADWPFAVDTRRDCSN